MNSNYIAVIQAGGKGTRMQDITKDRIPKPLLAINEKPMIQWQIENIKEYGITDFFIITGHLGEKIEKYFGDGQQFGVNIRYIRESEPLGSAGALYYVREQELEKNILLIFGDVMFDVELNRMISFHESNNSLVTLLVHPNAHPYDSDLIVLNQNNQVLGIDSKNKVRDYWYENLVNAGIYIIESEVIKKFDRIQRCDLENDVIKLLIPSGRVYGYRTPEYVKDAGTPQRFYACVQEQANGVWSQKCLRRKQKAVFLDRDGTINLYNGLIHKEEQFVLEEGAAEAIRLINSSGYLAVCVTNQPVVARGLCDIEDVVNIHKKMQTLLGESGSYLDDIVFCPHHPDRGFPEENIKYKKLCNCRKPSTGMIEIAKEKYNIDIDNSYIIGDSTVDIQTGINAGLHTILVRTGQAGEDRKYDVSPEMVANNLLEAVTMILS